MYSKRLGAVSGSVILVTLLAGCASGNSSACKTFEEAFSTWDYAMESASDQPGDVYASFAIEEMNEGIDKATESASGDVATALDLVAIAFAVKSLQQQLGTGDGNLRDSFRDDAEIMVEVCGEAGTPIELDFFVSGVPSE